MQRTTQPKVLNIRQEKELNVKRAIMVKARPRSNIAGFIIMAGVTPHRLAGSPMPVALVVKGGIRPQQGFAVLGGVPEKQKTQPKEKENRRKAQTRAKEKVKRTKASRGTRDSTDLGWARPS